MPFGRSLGCAVETRVFRGNEGRAKRVRVSAHWRCACAAVTSSRPVYESKLYGNRPDLSTFHCHRRQATIRAPWRCEDVERGSPAALVQRGGATWVRRRLA